MHILLVDVNENSSINIKDFFAKFYYDHQYHKKAVGEEGSQWINFSRIIVTQILDSLEPVL